MYPLKKISLPCLLPFPLPYLFPSHFSLAVSPSPLPKALYDEFINLEHHPSTELATYLYYLYNNVIQKLVFDNKSVEEKPV